MARSDSLWVDSDVILDWMAGRRPWDMAAVELMTGAVRGEWRLCFSPLTVANVFYVYRKQAGSRKALSAIGTLVKIGNVATMDATHVQRALAEGGVDFEDELQIACAASVPNVSAIITRNLADYAHATVPVMTAEIWIAR